MNALSSGHSQVSFCATHHINDFGMPLYDRRFSNVLPFHPPGLAPVRFDKKAWHIIASGEDAYSNRFDQTFGFYCNVAAVVLDGMWHHITPDGDSLYKERYAFVGNFQNDYCVVCDNEGKYFHIDLKGIPFYFNRWRYCGDFREGVAVVQGDNGKSSHINSEGILIHQQWFLDLDVFHKGFSRAYDATGWFHIDRKGRSIYAQRYRQIENFYNGCARVEEFNGRLLIINEQGSVLRELRSHQCDYFAEISADMVGYWKTFVLSTAAELKVLDYLPSTLSELAMIIKADEARLERLLWGLAEIEVICFKNNIWEVSEKGQYLLSSHDKTLQSAAIEYAHDLLNRWSALPNIMLGGEVKQDIFNNVAENPKRCLQHHRMLSSYSLHDYPILVELMNIQTGDVVFDAAGGSGCLSRIIKEHYPLADIICADLAPVLCKEDNVKSMAFDLFKPWEVEVNKIVLARVLHDWNDEQAVSILKHARVALLPKGEVLILEMLKNNRVGGALCDLHLLATTGGQERSLTEYKKLFAQAGLFLISSTSSSGLVSLLRVGIINE